MPDELLDRPRRFQTDAFPAQRSLFRHPVDEGQHPTTLFIGCSDSRLVPYLLTAGPGEPFLVAALPVAHPGPEALRRTEQRAIVLQLERLMDYPMVRERVEARTLSLHGWTYVIEDGEVHVFDIGRGGFVPASQAEHAGIGPYVLGDPDDPWQGLDASGVPCGG